MLVALTLLCAVQPVAGPLPANCSMVANDTAVAGGFCETIERETIEPCSKPLLAREGAMLPMRVCRECARRRLTVCSGATNASSQGLVDLRGPPGQCRCQMAFLFGKPADADPKSAQLASRARPQRARLLAPADTDTLPRAPLVGWTASQSKCGRWTVG